jgi:RNA 3'-terminal phosphate cyclase
MDAYQTIHFHCGTKNISYFLEPAMLLGIFSRERFSIEFTGITNDAWDQPVDFIRDQLVPLLKDLFQMDDLILKINKRGFKGNETGSVELAISGIKRFLPSINKYFFNLVNRKEQR